MKNSEIKELWQLANRLIQDVQRHQPLVAATEFRILNRTLQVAFSNGTLFTATVIWERPMFNTIYETFPNERWAIYSETLSLNKSKAAFVTEMALQYAKDQSKMPRPADYLPHWAKYFIAREDAVPLVPPDTIVEENVTVGEPTDEQG